MVSFWIIDAAVHCGPARPFWMRVAQYDAVFLVHDLSHPPSRHGLRITWMPFIAEQDSLVDEEGLIPRRRQTSDINSDRKPQVLEAAWHAARQLWRHSSEENLRACVESIDCVVQRAARALTDVVRSLLSTLLGADDLLNRAEERRILRAINKPLVLVGTKLDEIETNPRSNARRRSLFSSSHSYRNMHDNDKAGCASIHMDTRNALQQPQLSTFIRSVIERKIDHRQH
mmetsp:Transcript_16487/g.35813  ORF Transcript_16487/g.35813 Transcript_16487/m.35813 type:complete len:229 (-) Transcript_16487:702-1388(-)